MAKKRYSQPLLQNVPTTITPVARTVDTFVRPTAQQDVNQNLKAFVEGITPVLREASEQEKRQQLEETRAVVSGLKEQETYQARALTRKMALEAGQAFVENQDMYVADEAKLVSDREEFFTKNIQGLQDAGMSPAVLMAMQSEVEALNYEFFGKVYEPLVFDKKVNDAVDVLQGSINTISEAAMLSPEKQLELLTKEVKDFETAYPFVPKSRVNKTLEDTALVRSAALDKDGYVTGTNIYSEWMVQNNRHNVQANVELFQTIKDNEIKRQTDIAAGEAKATKSFTVTVNNAIKPIMNNLANELITDIDLYTDNKEAYEARVQEVIDQTVASFGDLNEADTAVVRSAVETAWALKASQDVTKVYDKRALEDITSDVVTALINFAPEDMGGMADAKFSQSFGAYFESVTEETNLSSEAAREDIATELLKQVKIATPLQGANLEILDYLGSKGYLSKEENQKLRADIIQAHEKYTRVAARKITLVQGLDKFIKSGNLNDLPTTYVNESGKPVNWNTSEIDRAFEENFGQYLKTDEKLEVYYKKVGRLPLESVNIVKSGSFLFSQGDLGTPTNPSVNIETASISYEEIKKLEYAGINPQKVLGNPDDALRYKLIKFQMEENGLSFEQSLRSVQTISNEQLSIKVTDTKKALSTLDKFTPGWANFAETQDKAVNVDRVLVIASNLKRLDPTKEDDTAIAEAVAIFSEDNIIIEDSEGYSTTLQHLSTDTNLDNVRVKANANFQASAMKQTPYMEGYVRKNWKGFENSFGIRYRTSSADPDMVDILITDGEARVLDTMLTVGKVSLLDGTVLDKMLVDKTFNNPDDKELEDLDSFTASTNYISSSPDDDMLVGSDNIPKSDMSTVTNTDTENFITSSPDDDMLVETSPPVTQENETTFEEELARDVQYGIQQAEISGEEGDLGTVKTSTVKPTVTKESTFDELVEYAGNVANLVATTVTGENMEVFKTVIQDPEVNDTLARAAKTKGIDEPVRILNEILMPIAYVESKGKNVQQAPRSITSKFGPGSGIYQFEGDAQGKGGSGSFKVALQRTANFFGDDVPQWVTDTQGTDKDARDLTESQQTVVLIADFMMKSGADISKVLDGTQSLEDFWIKSHWGGTKANTPAKRKQFQRDYEEYQELLKG